MNGGMWGIREEEEKEEKEKEEKEEEELEFVCLGWGVRRLYGCKAQNVDSGIAVCHAAERGA